MHCPRCQHENRPQANFCDKCASPFNGPSPTAPSSSDSKGEVESLRRALSEALAQQTATAELQQTRTRELAEAHEQQTATAEILRVISSSPTDIQPVFAAVLTSAARLCDAFDATIFQVDGDRLSIVAHEGPIPITPVGALPLIRGTAAGRAVLDRRTIHVPDLQAEVDEYPESSAIARSNGFRTVLNVPLLRGAEAIGAVSIRRTEVRPFTYRQIDLLQTFAAQAVIAIENVRLFTELQKKRALVEVQTATSEVLGVISRSPTDVQPVFDTIAQNAARLCGATDTVILRVEEGRLRPVAHAGTIPVGVPWEGFGIDRDSVTGRACQGSPHSEPPGSGKQSHPGSPIWSQAGSPMLSHPGAGIVSHPAGRDRISFAYPQPPCVAVGNKFVAGGDARGWTEESGDRHSRVASPSAVGRA